MGTTERELEDVRWLRVVANVIREGGVTLQNPDTADRLDRLAARLEGEEVVLARGFFLRKGNGMGRFLYTHSKPPKNSIPVKIIHARPDPSTSSEGGMDDFPRRRQVDKWIPAEGAIADAIEAVEDLPADDRLTDAVVLLTEAQEKVADYVDGVERSDADPVAPGERTTIQKILDDHVYHPPHEAAHRLRAGRGEGEEESVRCTCEWAHPVQGHVGLYPAELAPHCEVHGAPAGFPAMDEWCAEYYPIHQQPTDSGGSDGD